MCGIAGIFHYAEPDRPIDREVLSRMTRALKHRGPDDEGFHIDGPLGFGHRRLAIVDLSATGRQPMATPDGACWINYNGEFYNHEQFRPRLRDRGYRFRGTCDTETLACLLQAEGADALRKVAGIFAFAFWDAKSRRLLLGRDPIGVKQLYTHDDGRRICFASEIKALLECPDVPRDPDPEAINEYLHFHAPLFDRTFFRGIRQVRPGEVIEIGASGARARTYWRVESFGPLEGTPEEKIGMLRQRLGEVVREQLMADVPVGAFFSGGIDSTAVATFATRGGKRPRCFGVHFSRQGVIDERPFQEAAARSLGLDLQLITLDGSTFADDLMRLMYFQDQPMIGAAMIPMYHVSRLAARGVKVCLGGQAADEIFGGYARYGLARPWQVARSWLAGRGSRDGGGLRVGGNLWKQLVEVGTLKRLAHTFRNVGDWRARYFGNFAHVPEQAWRSLFAEGVVSREACREKFDETVSRSPATDPADAAMHWDLQTYLPGLLHQDDRMSMAHGLESRVPMADPRLVEFAFRLGFDLKFRGGATKWILREAVADVIPAEVLNRRKVGFDTPAEAWMRGSQAAFVRDLLLSSEARNRGLWKMKGLEALLRQPQQPNWFDMTWKALCVEAWARVFLQGNSPYSAAAPGRSYEGPSRSSPSASGGGQLPTCAERAKRVEALPNSQLTDVRRGASALKDATQELRELGLPNALFRAGWEAKTWTGLAKALARRPARDAQQVDDGWMRRLFADPRGVVQALAGRVPGGSLAALQAAARDAARGRILCFGNWTADFGDPIDWQLNPENGKRWDAAVHWSRALQNEEQMGDVKLTWEVARFAHAYLMARAGAFDPASRDALLDALARQIEGFMAANPYGRGIHWNSGQEIVLRLMAWVFASRVFEGLGQTLGAHVVLAGTHLEENIGFARKSVYNNHLLAEALGLYLASRLVPTARRAERWRRTGLAILEEQAGRQIYRDGGYIQNAHNYHRVAMQYYLWAWACVRADGGPPPPSVKDRGPLDGLRRASRPPEEWRQAMERSLDFLRAHQNPADGSLPNYGANDGALPSPLSTCGFSDFRPTLQALSLATRGERLYPPGPWDEEAAWFLGPEALEAPLRHSARVSVSFAHTGYHVLRGRDEGSFGAFRCGTILDRFSQIDMLHLDVWWRGLNVLADGGSYLYNGPAEWHDHFFRTGSHNTVEVDGRDQMLHYRRFKSLYWTRARLLRFEDAGPWALCEGEHTGYRRHPGRCVHRRSVLFVKNDLWVVVDAILGEDAHRVRLHWLCGDFPCEYTPARGELTLKTPAGAFAVTVLDAEARPLAGDVVAGQERPPRGWLSRYYGRKIAVPSLAAVREVALPTTMVSVLSGQSTEVGQKDGLWGIEQAAIRVGFALKDGAFDQLRVETAP